MKNYLRGMLVISVLIFTSCGDETNEVLTPNLSFLGGSYTSSDVTVTTEDTLNIGIVGTENVISGKKLKYLNVTLTSSNIPNILLDSAFSNENIEYQFQLFNLPEGTHRISATLTDKNDESSDIAFNIISNAATTDLGSESSFVWERVGGNNASGLAMFGLEWTSNAKAVNAQIEIADANKFVELSSGEWTSITTQEALAEAVDNGTGISLYDGVSAENNSSYDTVLATEYNGEYFMMHIESANITTGSAGTTITINGNYKK